MYLPPVFIGSDALKYVTESKYLGFSFCDSSVTLHNTIQYNTIQYNTIQ